MMELLNMEVHHLAILNKIAYEENKSEETKKAKEGQDMQDALEDM